MHATTPAGNPAPISPHDRHGDVDTNGDLVDELHQAVRLRASISAVTPDLEAEQLDAVRRLLRIA